MNELALFAGSGGGILGGLLLGWRTVCAVEIVAYRRERLLQRQREGHLPEFPIWDDVTTFDGRQWNGFVDVVSGGFPCQDISAAGAGAGIRGSRSGLWAEFARIIGEVQPCYVWVENSPVLTSRGLGVVLGDLSALGFDAQWGVVSAADAIWANSLASGHFPVLDHLRERIWIWGTRSDAEGQSVGTGLCASGSGRVGRGRSGDRGGSRTDAALRRLAMRWWASGNGRHAVRGDLQAEDAAGDDAEQARLEGRGDDAGQSPQRESRGPSQPDAGANGSLRDGRADEPGREAEGRSAVGRAGWWESESGLDRVATRVANRVDRISAIGDGQVPAVVALAWSLLSGERGMNQ